jgi:hypothetical protein
MGKIKRSLVGTFINTGTILSPDWVLLGTGITSAKINMNPKTTEETYIDDDNASISVDSYAPTLPIEQIANEGEDAFEYLDAIRKNRSTLGDAESEIVNVYMYFTPVLTYYRAEKQAVGIQVDDFGGDGGKPVKLNYTINYIGEPVLGEFSPSDLAFLASPVLAKLNTMVIGSVTLTPLFATDKTWLHYAGSVSNATTTVTMNSTCTAAGAVVVQKDRAGGTVTQGNTSALNVGVNHLTIQVTVGTEVVTYYIDITRAAS